MEFVHPEILWALPALAIPIAIHLLNFRRFQKVNFSQVAFLKEVQKESKAMQQIKRWLILLLRLLALACIIVAFAQPYLPPPMDSESDTRRGEGQAISLYVDNSHSMESIGESGQLLQSAKNKASVVVQKFESTDRFQILTNDFSGRDQIFLTQEQALERLTQIQTSPMVRPVETIMKRMAAQLEKEPLRKRVSYLFSDLQKSTHRFSLESSAADTSISWHFIPEFGSDAPNIWVDSIWFEEPIQLTQRQASLRLRIQHNSMQAVEGLPMNLRVEGEKVAVGTFNLVPGLATDTALRFTHGFAGLYLGHVDIQDAPIQFDDDMYFGYEVRDQIRVLHITDDLESITAQTISSVFKSANSLYKLRTASTWTPSEFDNEHLVLISGATSPSSGLSQTIASFVRQGGSVCYIPNRAASSTDFYQALNASSAGNWISQSDRIAQINTQHPFFTGVFETPPESMNLPAISELWRRKPIAREEVLASTLLGYPFLSQLRFGQGTAYFLATNAEPSYSNLTRHALLVPILLRMAEQAKATPMIWSFLGQKKPIAIHSSPENSETVSLEKVVFGTNATGTDPSTSQNWLPKTQFIQGHTSLLTQDLELTAGHYNVNFSAETAAVIGLNQDRGESNPDAYSIQAFEAQWSDWDWDHVDVIPASAASLSEVIDRLEKASSFWFYFILSALLFLFAESFLLHAWKQSS
jgi:hypothetical protein